jgi:putative ABC transport system substrate-binding protein
MNKKVLGLVLGTLLLLLNIPVDAQMKKVWRIGFLRLGSPSDGFLQLRAFREALRQLGYVEGQNILIQYRYADGRNDRLSDLAADLVSLKPDIIVAGGTEPILAVKKSTATIPIVMAISSDPLGSKLIHSLDKPGGNITGLSILSPELSGKRLELFKEVFPNMRRIAVLSYPTSKAALIETQAAAKPLELTILSLEVRVPEDFDSAILLISRERPDGLVTIPSAFLTANRKRILDFMAKNRLPAIYHAELFIEDGGLMSYAASVQDSYRRAASYVDKILQGAKPADLPVQQPTKFELVINLKTAKQIGLTIPPNVLARADRVIR